MTTAYDELNKGMAERPRARLEYQARQQGADWRPLGAIVGLSGGIMVALTGSLLTAITWFTGTAGDSSDIHTSGTILLFMTIPLLVFGAHCLDLTEKQKDRGRDFRFRAPK